MQPAVMCTLNPAVHVQLTSQLLCLASRFSVQINILTFWPQDWMTVLGISSLSVIIDNYIY